MADENIAGSVVVQVKADLTDLEKGLAKAQQKTEAAGKEMGKASKEAKDLGDSVKKTGKDAGDAADKLDWVGTVVDELAKGLKSTVGPAALAGAAFTAASGAALAAFQALRPQIKTADDLLAEHEKNILRLGDAYDVVNEKQHRYASDTANTANARSEGAFKAMRDIVSGQIKLIFDDVYRTIGGGSGNQGPLARVMDSQFKPFESALNRLAEEARKTVPDIKAVQDEITNIAKADPKRLNATRDILRGLLDGVAENTARLPELSRQFSEAMDIVDQFNRQIDNVDSKPLREELQKIFDDALNGKKGIGDVLLELNKLERANPSFAGIIAGFQSLIEAAASTNDALDRIGAKYFANTGGSPNGRGRPTVFLPDTAPTPDHRPNAEDWNAANDKRLARLARAGSRAGNPYRDLIKSADDRIKQMRTELELMGKVGVAADTLRAYQELLSRATDRGRTIGEKQKKELHDRAEAMAKLEDATKKAQLAQDLLFERAQLFRSPIDQTIAETMRGAGLEVDFNSPIAGMIRLNEQLKMAKDYADDFASTFVDGIMSGENALDALGDAASSVLSDIAKQLIQMAMNQMINSLLQGLGGAFGGGFGMFPGGMGFATPGYVGTYAGGGHVRGPGTNTSDSILARLSNGEFVVNAASARAHMPLLEAINRSPGFESGGSIPNGVAPLRSASLYGGAPRHDNQNGKISVAVYNNGGAVNAEARQSTDANGDRMIEIFLEKKIQDEVTRPSASTNRQLRSAYGLSNQVVRR
ncbi:MAG: hypothetical protein ABS35_42030 [Kaistia sp. SCN 65-12]|nr:MAG: hypothetical protein ABS35_42030 [Kaistia sp. SCN 65-12]